jgi:DNA-directed RNA polymerase beta subunit
MEDVEKELKAAKLPDFGRTYLTDGLTGKTV